MTPEEISEALDSKNSNTRIEAIKDPSATPKEIDKALNYKYDPWVRELAARHPNASSENIFKAMNDEEWYVRLTALQHPNVTVEHINKALVDKDWHTRLAVITHPNATAEHLYNALKDKDGDVVEGAITEAANRYFRQYGYY
jgi:HEAT repeat protein